MASPELQTLIQILSKLPSLGPRSGRRMALHLLKNRETTLRQLIHTLGEVEAKVKTCSTCGNLDTLNPCPICTDPRRDQGTICVLEDVADLWALEKTASYRGLYHVLGGTLSALDGVGPQDLRIEALLNRCRASEVTEIILALNATVDGQTTSHYLQDQLQDLGVTNITSLARGVPVGGELDYLDEGTLTTALASRRVV